LDHPVYNTDGRRFKGVLKQLDIIQCVDDDDFGSLTSSCCFGLCYL